MYCCFAFTSKDGSKAWRAEITEFIEGVGCATPHSRWWYGVDVGLSSAAIFAALCPDRRLAEKSAVYSSGSTPRDEADLSRCVLLLQKFPEWRGRLNEVAEKYHDTAWPEIVASWDALESAGTNGVMSVLNRCHDNAEARKVGGV